MSGQIQEIAVRWALVACCAVAPFLFALVATQAPILLTSYDGDAAVLKIPGYVFLPEAPAESNAARPGSDEKKTGGNAEKGRPRDEEKINPRDLNALLVARDISGRLRYVAVSALLWLISAAGIIYGAAILARRLGAGVMVIALVLALAAAVWLPWLACTFERVRPLIAELVLQNADAKHVLPAAPYWDNAYILTILVRVNTGVALFAVGMLLAALCAISLRASEVELTFRDLATRREIAHWLLGIGSAILVVAVVASQILVEWPPSLLVTSQQLALKPIGDAMTLLLGATGTIALLAAFAPAIAAFALDVGRYRLVNAAAADRLGFATASTITAVIAALAPLLASSLIEALKAFL